MQCRGQPVKAFLSLTRKENCISSSLKRRLGLDTIKHREYCEDEIQKCLFIVENQVCLTISSGMRRVFIVAAVVNKERDLILGTDAMNRLGITLQMDNLSIPLPQKRPLSRDWVLDVLTEVERSMRAPQRGIPTCVKCGKGGHLKIYCRLKTLVLSPDANEGEEEETDPSAESSSDSLPSSRRRRVQLLSPDPPTSESSDWESTHSIGESDFSHEEEFLPPSPSADDNEEYDEGEGEGEPEPEDCSDNTSSGISSESDDLSDYQL